MADVDLNFIARLLTNVVSEQRAARDELRGVQVALRAVRDEIGLMREEIRITVAATRRLDDTIAMNVLDRLQALEVAGEKNE